MNRMAWCKMTLALILVASLITVSRGDITGTDPANGACLCYNGYSVRIRSSACGEIIGSANKGQCYKYTASKSSCTLDKEYEFFRFDYGGKEGWSAGVYLDLADDSSCSSPGGAENEYTCDVINEGKRVHETTSSTPYDCVDSRCGNTCKGGQCVAYVTCNCKRNDKWAPNTRCWRPGQPLKTSDGKCNSNIAANTAIATFNSEGHYYAGHAAVFIKCEDDYTILVYDQWCCRSVGYSRYGSTHSYFNTFATITSPGCSDRDSWPCRVEDSGQTCCKASSNC